MEETIKNLKKTIEFLRNRFQELSGEKTTWGKVEVIDKLIPTMFLQSELSKKYDENLIGIFKHKLIEQFRIGRNDCSFQYLIVEFERVLNSVLMIYFVDLISGKILKNVITLTSEEFSNLVLSSYNFGISQATASLNAASEALINNSRTNEEMSSKIVESIKYLLRGERSKFRE